MLVTLIVTAVCVNCAALRLSGDDLPLFEHLFDGFVQFLAVVAGEAFIILIAVLGMKQIFLQLDKLDDDEM